MRKMRKNHEKSCLVADLPEGAAPQPLALPHFPTPWQAFIWRNWGYVTADKLAAVLGCQKEVIVREAQRMGLNTDSHYVSPKWLTEGYQTVIRDNWHILPYSQLLQLLDWTPERMLYVLKEEDFLWVKLGLLKPACKELRYQPLTSEQIVKTQALEKLLLDSLPSKQALEYLDEPFAFDKKYRAPASSKCSKRPFELTFIHSYAASCGDVFYDIDANDPIPDSLLKQYSALGVQGVWMHAILYLLHPIASSEEYSEGWQKRLENLRVLTERCDKYGLKLFLYLNEPRGMPMAFYDAHPDWAGVPFPEKFMRANCTSQKKVLDWMEEALYAVFSAAPRLGGAFFITMSENPTHCNSRLTVAQCPWCIHRPGEELIAEVLATAERGIHRASPGAVVMAEDWSWRDFAGEEGTRPAFEEQDVIRLLPENVWLLCISEWGLETNFGGVQGSIRDYSISQVGPSTGTKQAWNEAKKRGLKTIAKIQMNNSWELSAIPYIPVPYLLQEHLENLEREKIDGLMLSWTLGGYPGGNLELLRHKTVEELSEAKFSAQLAPKICQAWRMFSEAFREFPCDLVLLYCAPMNIGPANLLHPQPSNYKATMISYPYDDLESWRSIYPEDVVEDQFLKLTNSWKKGLDFLRQLEGEVSSVDQSEFEELTSMAQAAYCHLRSTFLQIRFIRLRNEGNTGLLKNIVQDEKQLALQLLGLARRDARIGFEASNHYYYSLQGLAEKVIQCNYLLATELCLK
ncbi:MAG: hypothetical protein GX946_11640 [Oligosphaeraceae bacterium]|nr:hypothetical protein [Oligosphaeraceae bacterium]